MQKKTPLLSETDGAQALPGDIVWLKGAEVSAISAYLDILKTRELNLFYCGPADRYIVAHDRGEADLYLDKRYLP
jgi:hypothetical protein